MSTSPSVHLAGAENRDIFDSLESSEKLLTAREVARILSISEKTVKTHLTNVFRRIGVTDRTQAALWAQRHGLASAPPDRS